MLADERLASIATECDPLPPNKSINYQRKDIHQYLHRNRERQANLIMINLSDATEALFWKTEPNVYLFNFFIKY